MERSNDTHRRRVSPAGPSFSFPVTEAHKAPLEEESFMRYYELAMKAASTKGPAPRVKDRLLRNQDDTCGRVLDVVFGDDPLSRMTIALRNRLSEEGQIDRYPAVSARILALINAIGSGSLMRWAISGPRDAGHLYYPDALVFAAAVSPLNDDLTFQMDEFERRVELHLGGINCSRFTALV
jgi:hypothetical protein